MHTTHTTPNKHANGFPSFSYITAKWYQLIPVVHFVLFHPLSPSPSVLERLFWLLRQFGRHDRAKRVFHSMPHPNSIPIPQKNKDHIIYQLTIQYQIQLMKRKNEENEKENDENGWWFNSNMPFHSPLQFLSAKPSHSNAISIRFSISISIQFNGMWEKKREIIRLKRLEGLYFLLLSSYLSYFVPLYWSMRW